MDNFMKRFVRFVLIIVIYAIVIIVSLKQPARSQVLDSSFYHWRVYEMQENELEDKKCYIISHPIKSDSNHNSRQKPYIMITRFQKDRSEEFSVFSGYEYKLNSQIFALVDDYQFKLYAKKDIAWMLTKEDDAQIISTALNAAVAKVRSDSSVGTYGVDEYSLKGITRAYARMKEICK